MTVKFNEETILCGYIKQMLHSFNLPNIPVFSSVSEMKEYYGDYSGIGIIKKYLADGDYIVKISAGKVVSEKKYSFGAQYLNITTNMSLHNGVYDSTTHIYLGNYLRFLRDYLGIDLMSMYNCYSNITFTDNKYKYISIPVKYNKKYTLAFDGKISYYFGFDNNLIAIQNSFADSKYVSVINKTCDFRYPIIIEAPKHKDIFKENLYRMIIRVDISDTSSIVAIEKTFNHLTCNSTAASGKAISMVEKSLIKIQPNFENTNVALDKYLNNISLLNKKNYNEPFSPRLVEYLCCNAITPADRISKNIIDAKYKFYLKYGSEIKKCGAKNRNLNIKVDFTELDRARFLFAVYEATKVSKDTTDLLGYVDKDVEYCLSDSENFAEE